MIYAFSITNCFFKSSPSLQKWKDTFVICLSCTSDLDLVYQFREKCLRADRIRHLEGVPFEQTSSNVDPKIAIQKTETEKPCSNKFACEHCNLSFKLSTRLIDHMIKSHDINRKEIKPFNCQICNQAFAKSRNLARHLSYHKDTRDFVCTFCGKGFKTPTDLRVHEKIHTNLKEYKCDNCDKSFNTHKALHTHNYVVHTDRSQWLHHCKICSRRFAVKTNFDTHMRRHTNERPFGCHICDKKFIDNFTLQKHKLSHSNKRDFLCSICGNEYKDRKVRDVHLKRCHGIGNAKVPAKVKKFLCHLCSKSFYDNNKLQRHVRTHTGEKPFACNLCPKRFIDKSYVTQHLKKVHDVGKIEAT